MMLTLLFTFVYIPPGFFWRGSSPWEREEALYLCQQEEPSCELDRFSDEGPARWLFLQGFWISKTEITQAEYDECIQQQRCTKPAMLGQAQDLAQPVVGVSWQQARDYCSFVDARLPSEAEWEKAARGVDGRLFPWGDVYTNLRARHREDSLLSTQPTPAAVGTFSLGQSPYGVQDMAGNVWEWTEDDYLPEAYLRGSTRAVKYTSEFRVLRGGSFLSLVYTLRTANRGQERASRQSIDVGFRCAKSNLPRERGELWKNLLLHP